jgi:hypothetical protein
VALTLLPLVAVWSADYFPSQDGPAHVEIAEVLKELLRPERSVFDDYFALVRFPEPNWLIYPPLMLLLDAFTPAVAEKLLVSGYLVLFPLALRYAVRGVRAAGAHVAFLGLPLTLNYPLHMGFFNFSYGCAVFFLAVGYHRRSTVPLTARRTCGLALLLVLAYLIHPVPLAMALLAIAAATIEDLGVAWRRDRADRRRLATIATRPLLAALPALLLLFAFLERQGVGRTPHLSLVTLGRHLLVLYSLISFGRAEIIASAALAVLLGALVLLVLWRRAQPSAGRPSTPRPRPGDTFLAATVATVALYLLAPVGISGGYYLNQRLQLFVVFMLLLWLAAQPELDRWAGAVRTGGAALAFALVAIHGGHYARLEPYFTEIASAAPVLDPDRTLLRLSFSHRGRGPDGPLSLRVFPFEHAAARLAAERRLVDLNDYQAGQGYFPVVYSPRCNPLALLGTFEEMSSERPRVRLDGYPPSSGCAIDYVLLLWPPPPGVARAPDSFFQDLDRGFERALVSQRGAVEVYRRRDL